MSIFVVKLKFHSAKLLNRFTEANINFLRYKLSTAIKDISIATQKRAKVLKQIHIGRLSCGIFNTELV